MANGVESTGAPSNGVNGSKPTPPAAAAPGVKAPAAVLNSPGAEAVKRSAWMRAIRRNRGPRMADSAPDAKTVSLWQRFRRVITGTTVAVVGTAIFLGVALWFAWPILRPPTYKLTMTSGTAGGRSYTLAEQYLVPAARERGVEITMVPTAGSEEGLDAVNDPNNPIQLALVQGGLEASTRPNVRELTPTHTTVLHLFLKRSVYEDAQKRGIKAALTGKRISLSTPGSGTHTFATAVAKRMGLEAGVNFIQEPKSNGELTNPRNGVDQLPDGVFVISILPSPVGNRLVDELDYRLYPLAFSEALRLEDPKVYPATIPAFTYSVDPPVPEQRLNTISRRLLLVANKDVPEDAVVAMLGAVFESGFARVFEPGLDMKTQLDLEPEFPRHPGVNVYRYGRIPISQETIQQLTKGAPALTALIPGFFFLRRSVSRYRHRDRVHSLRDYMVEVTTIESTVRDWEMGPSLSTDDVMRMRNRLSELKGEALDRYAQGILLREELMPSFLAHVTDVRNYLSAMLKEDDGEADKALPAPPGLDDLFEDLAPTVEAPPRSPVVSGRA